MRKLAGGDHAVRDHITVLTSFLHHFSGKGERAAGSESNVSAFEAGAGSSGDVVEFSGLGVNVVSAVAGGDVHVVGAAIEKNMAFSGQVAGDALVGNGVSAQCVAAIFDFYVAAQRKYLSFFLLLVGADGERLAFSRGDPQFVTELTGCCGRLLRCWGFRPRLADN